jgi:hypothetical protein
MNRLQSIFAIFVPPSFTEIIAHSVKRGWVIVSIESIELFEFIELLEFIGLKKIKAHR